jgi:hypothetical protein
MLSITPCQRIISDRFPVASFVVNTPPQRLFEIACATDPTLFRPDQRHRRTAQNFFTTRLGGLMRAPAGHATYLMPPEQLRRFAGARRLFYNVGSYAGPSGEDAHFHVAPDAADAIPSIQISPDFTGKSLDRGRLGGYAVRADAAYGARAQRMQELTWGADLLRTAAAAPTPSASYDDGYAPELWKRTQTRAQSHTQNHAQTHAQTKGSALGGAAPDARSANPSSAPLDEPAGYEDAPDLVAHAGGLPMPEPTGASPIFNTAAPQAFRYGGAAARSSHAPASPAAAALRYGGTTLREPPGLEDGAALNRRAAGAQPQGAPPRGVLGSGAVDLPGFEDAPSLARSRQRRYGAAGDGALEPASPQPAMSLPTTPPSDASTVAPSGRDDDYDDSLEPSEEPEPLDDPAALDTLQQAAVPLTIPEKFKLVALVARSEGGAGRDAYAALNADGEFRDPSHAFFGRKHVGLSWGIVQFTQLGGALGRALSACQRRDPEQFASVFGADADALLRVTNAATEAQRLQPVGASVLWEGDWPERFVRAGQIAAFQAAQNEVAIEGYLDPNLPFARFLGWNTDRALALLYDRCVHMGNRAALSWVIRAVAPIRSLRQRSAALHALGYPDLQSFAASVPELAGDTRWTALSEAALVGALASLGNSAPFPLPSLPEQLDRIVNAARGRRFAERVERLRNSSELSDTPYQLLG